MVIHAMISFYHIQNSQLNINNYKYFKLILEKSRKILRTTSYTTFSFFTLGYPSPKQYHSQTINYFTIDFHFFVKYFNECTIYHKIYIKDLIAILAIFKNVILFYVNRTQINGSGRILLHSPLEHVKKNDTNNFTLAKYFDLLF